MIFILSRTTKKYQKILEARPLHSKLKKIQGLFKDLHRNLRTFQGKLDFEDFSRLREPWFLKSLKGQHYLKVKGKNLTNNREIGQPFQPLHRLTKVWQRMFDEAVQRAPSCSLRSWRQSRCNIVEWDLTGEPSRAVRNTDPLPKL